MRKKHTFSCSKDHVTTSSRQDIIRSKADIQIEAASVNTRNAQRDEHFRSADFFDVEHNPYITFKSKRVIMQDAHHRQLVGDLTIRNITREVVLDGEFSGVSQTRGVNFSQEDLCSSAEVHASGGAPCGQ